MTGKKGEGVVSYCELGDREATIERLGMHIWEFYGVGDRKGRSGVWKRGSGHSRACGTGGVGTEVLVVVWGIEDV